MCDRCRTFTQVMASLGLDPQADDLEDEIQKAARRLRCYYQCVTEDALEDEHLFEDPRDDPDLEDDDDELGLPRY